MSRQIMTIGQRLKLLRGELSQAKFGKELFGLDLGAAQAKVKRIEAGTQELTVKKYVYQVKICLDK